APCNYIAPLLISCLGCVCDVMDVEHESSHTHFDVDAKNWILLDLLSKMHLNTILQAFSVFFVFIAATSDMICFLFIPVHWLFFAASTYVWVQYVWHTERGICLPTVSLWLLFVYIEASVRLRELKNLPFHLDLCRPFAAHWYAFPFTHSLSHSLTLTLSPNAHSIH